LFSGGRARAFLPARTVTAVTAGSVEINDVRGVHTVNAGPHIRIVQREASGGGADSISVAYLRELTMSISGQIYGITDPKGFFTAVLLGQKPTTGFTPLSKQNFEISMLGVTSLPSNPNLHHVQNGAVAPANCSFTFPDYPANFDVKDVAINLSLNGHPVYRSTMFSYARAQQGGLDIYINQPVLPPADAITAGEISQHLGGAGLPSDTTLTSNPWGIWVAGDQSGANVQFGVKLVPHTSTNLNVFADIGIDGWNIHVGFPADCKLSADDILNKIKTMLATDDSAVNAFIKTKVMQFLTGIAGNFANQVYGVISITFTSIAFPTKHTWPLSDTKDGAGIITIGPTIGYPQKW